ncbi:MAG: right-handed parallel beta-helix repeat-containing protein [Candidatus Sumerlaeota bacterium]|nr:right-handed parallel beta-helix repeat-containing protein [Candidatus Sumerlaeota bacterium]
MRSFRLSRRCVLIALCQLYTAVTPQAKERHVSPAGADDNSGAAEAPYLTIQRAAGDLKPGDVCFIHAGTYREAVKLTASGDKEKSIRFTSYNGERVILDGSDVVAGPWTQDKEKVWRAKVDANGPIEAVLCDGRMMVEARWPNCSWEDNWDPDKKWALTDKGSAMGRIKCSAMAQSGQDLSGGRLYIRLSKGNSCYTRPVLAHGPGADTLEYDTAGIEGRAWGEDSMPERIKKFGFARNRFFVAARGALDAPGEWWHDTERGELLVVFAKGDDPARHEVSVKTRVAGFEGAGVSDIVLEGLDFHACNVRIEKSRRITLRDCRFLYPSTPNVFPDQPTSLATSKHLRIEGSENVVERCLIEWAVDMALEVEGAGNRVENCVVHDCNLHGRHPGPGIILRGAGSADGAASAPAPNVVRRCTVYNTGGVGIYALGQGPATAEYNHVFNAGLYCVDVSSLYVPTGGLMPGTVVHHNWLHDVHGIGFRVDIEGRDIVFHHNLVWNASSGCKMQGFKLLGYNNSIIVDARQSAFIVVFEPEATPEERAGWRVRNNVAYAFHDRKSLRGDYSNAKRPFLLPLKPEEGAIDHNTAIPKDGEADLFVDFTAYDFRPRPGGPLDAAGVAVPAIAEGTNGRPPSIGAYETGESPWKVGADWMDDNLLVPATEREAADLARRLRPVSCPVGRIDRQYERQ